MTDDAAAADDDDADDNNDISQLNRRDLSTLTVNIK